MADRRDQLIAAALTIAAREGIEAATVRAVAVEAGVSAGVVHYCFQDKNELLTCMARAITQLNTPDLALAAGEDTGEAVGEAGDEAGAGSDDAAPNDAAPDDPAPDDAASGDGTTEGEEPRDDRTGGTDDGATAEATETADGDSATHGTAAEATGEATAEATGEATAEATAGATGEDGADERPPLDEVLFALLTAMWEALESTRGLQLLTYELTVTSLRAPELAGVAMSQYESSRAAAAAVLTHAATLAGVTWNRPLDELARFVVAVIDGAALAWLVDGDADAARQILGTVIAHLVGFADESR